MIKGIIFDMDGTLIRLPINYEKIFKKLKILFDTNDEFQDWTWKDEEGRIVAHTDLDFRETIYPDLVNRFNNEMWDEMDNFGEISPIVGFDYYHYSKNFWLHSYGSYFLPYHHYVRGNEDFSYLHRNSWGKGGHNNLLEGEQWHDYQFGTVLGWKLSNVIGLFAEGEYNKMWDREFFTSKIGINITFK